MKQIIIAAVAAVFLLTSCSSGPSDSAVQTAIAQTQAAQAKPGQPTQAKSTPPALKTNTPSNSTASASISFLVYDLVKVSTENGWNNYTARYAIKNLTNQFLYVNSNKGTYSASYVNYYVPVAGAVVETSEGNKYPVDIAYYRCDIPKIALLGANIFFPFPPNTAITKMHIGGLSPWCLGLTFKVPETMKPARMVLFTSPTSQMTIDLTSVPAALDVNNPVGSLSLPTTVKGAPFEITIEPPTGKYDSDGRIILFSFKTTIKNTNLAGDMKWQKLDRALTVGKVGYLEGIEIEGKDSLKSEIVIGPGQSKTVTLYQSMIKDGFTPGPRTMFFYTGTEWVSIQVNFPAP